MKDAWSGQPGIWIYSIFFGFIYLCSTFPVLKLYNHLLSFVLLALLVFLRVDRPSMVDTLNRTGCDIHTHITEFILKLIHQLLFGFIPSSTRRQTRRPYCSISSILRSSIVIIFSNMATLPVRSCFSTFSASISLFCSAVFSSRAVSRSLTCVIMLSSVTIFSSLLLMGASIDSNTASTLSFDMTEDGLLLKRVMTP